MDYWTPTLNANTKLWTHRAGESNALNVVAGSVINMKKVTQEEWGRHLMQYSCYATERTPNTLDHIHNETKEHVAQVVYLPEKEYYINTELKANPK